MAMVSECRDLCRLGARQTERKKEADAYSRSEHGLVVIGILRFTSRVEGAIIVLALHKAYQRGQFMLGSPVRAGAHREHRTIWRPGRGSTGCRHHFVYPRWSGMGCPRTIVDRGWACRHLDPYMGSVIGGTGVIFAPITCAQVQRVVQSPRSRERRS